jgi:lipopolysaccharide/colanic/teichoic acid biosynthesis glycosyltransferase
MYTVFKRAFDILFSLLGLILVFPFLLVCAYLIKNEDGQRVYHKLQSILGKQIHLHLELLIFSLLYRHQAA